MGMLISERLDDLVESFEGLVVHLFGVVTRNRHCEQLAATVVSFSESESDSCSSYALGADRDRNTFLATSRIRGRSAGDDHDGRCRHARHSHRCRPDEHTLQTRGSATAEHNELGIGAAIGQNGRRVTQDDLSRDPIGVHPPLSRNMDGVINNDLTGILQSGRVIDDSPGARNGSVINGVKDNKISISLDR